MVSGIVFARLHLSTLALLRQTLKKDNPNIFFIILANKEVKEIRVAAEVEPINNLIAMTQIKEIINRLPLTMPQKNRYTRKAFNFWAEKFGT